LYLTFDVLSKKDTPSKRAAWADSARASLTRAEELDPGSEQVRLARANTFLGSPAAIPLYESLLGSRTVGNAARFNLALAYYEIGEMAKVSEVLAKLPSWDPSYPKAKSLMYEANKHMASVQRQTQEAAERAREAAQARQSHTQMAKVAMKVLLILALSGVAAVLSGKLYRSISPRAKNARELRLQLGAQVLGGILALISSLVIAFVK
jgi:predicted Zn-dependent protease